MLGFLCDTAPTFLVRSCNLAQIRFWDITGLALLYPRVLSDRTVSWVAWLVFKTYWTYLISWLCMLCWAVELCAQGITPLCYSKTEKDEKKRKRFAGYGVIWFAQICTVLETVVKVARIHKSLLLWHGNPGYMMYSTCSSPNFQVHSIIRILWFSTSVKAFTWIYRNSARDPAWETLYCVSIDMFSIPRTMGVGEAERRRASRFQSPDGKNVSKGCCQRVGGFLTCGLCVLYRGTRSAYMDDGFGATVYKKATLSTPVYLYINTFIPQLKTPAFAIFQAKTSDLLTLLFWFWPYIRLQCCHRDVGLCAIVNQFSLSCVRCRTGYV